jgi:hypothetical protein
MLTQRSEQVCELMAEFDADADVGDRRTGECRERGAWLLLSALMVAVVTGAEGRLQRMYGWIVMQG